MIDKKKLLKCFLWGAGLAAFGILFTGVTGISKTGYEGPFNIIQDAREFVANPLPSIVSFMIVALLLTSLLYFADRSGGKH